MTAPYSPHHGDEPANPQPAQPGHPEPPPGQPHYGSQQYGQGPQQIYMQPMHGMAVQKSGISGTGHAVHAVLTVLTCGAWGVVWFLHWLFTRNKTVTRY